MLTASPADRYARTALQRECEDLARTVTGRNARLNRAAFALGGFVGGGHLSRGEVENALLEAAIVCGYVGKDGPRQARDTIRSGIERGMMEPRDAPARESGRTEPDVRETARQAQAREQQRRLREEEDAAKAERVLRIWREAQPDPRGTLVEQPYLNRHRGLVLPLSVCGHAIRFHPAGPWERERAPMMVCALRDIVTNAVVGLHRTRLDPTTGAKVDRKMLGRAGAAAIKLTPDQHVTMGLAIAEGVETALAAMALGLAPVWALGSANGIAAFPVLSGIESLTLLAENDASGTNQRACEQAAERWYAAGRQVDIIVPRVGKDLNDTLRAGAAA